MKKKLTFLFLIYFNLSFGQNLNKDNTLLLNWFDSKVKQENLNINKGFRYTEKHRTFDNSSHFINNSFKNGSINYENQLYNNIPCNFDILDDNLIIKIPSSTENYSIILNKDKVSDFEINGKVFIKLKNTFYELIVSSNNKKLLKKHIVKKKEFKKNKRTYYIFKKKAQYYVLDNSNIIPLEKKRNWLALFPSKTDEINNYFKHKKNSTKFTELLFKKLSQ